MLVMKPVWQGLGGCIGGQTALLVPLPLGFARATEGYYSSLLQ